MKNGFGHINTYARRKSKLSKSQSRRTASNVTSEATREKEYSLHVKSAQKPIHFHGIPIEQLDSALDEFLADKYDTYLHKNGTTKQRKIRADKHVLLASVYSWPEPTNNYDAVKFEKFCKLCVEFFEKEHEILCQSAVIHTDESYPHLHVFGFSTDARAHFCGWRAKREALENGASEKQSNIAFKESSRLYQDRYHKQVTEQMGLSRLGPQRIRYDNKTFKIMKNAVEVKSNYNKLEKNVENIKIEYNLIEKSLFNTKDKLKEELEKKAVIEADIKRLTISAKQKQLELNRINQQSRLGVIDKFFISTNIKKFEIMDTQENKLAKLNNTALINSKKLKEANLVNKNLLNRLKELESNKSSNEELISQTQQELNTTKSEINFLKNKINEVISEYEIKINQIRSEMNLLFSDPEKETNHVKEINNLIIKS